MPDLADAILEELTALHRRLREAVAGLDRQALDWVPTHGANSIAVLVTHTVGSELDWLHIACGRSSERDRDAEFRAKGRGSDELAALVERAERAAGELVRSAVGGGLETVRRSRNGREATAAYCLQHALAHTAEHVGQIELTRQLATARGDAKRE